MLCPLITSRHANSLITTQLRQQHRRPLLPSLLHKSSLAAKVVQTTYQLITTKPSYMAYNEINVSLSAEIIAQLRECFHSRTY
jgi:hypothetical protein